MKEEKVWFCNTCSEYHYKRNMSNIPKMCIICKDDYGEALEEERNILEKKLQKIRDIEEIRTLKIQIKLQKEQIKIEKEQNKLKKIKLKIEEDEKLRLLKLQLNHEKEERLRFKRKNIIRIERDLPEDEKKLKIKDRRYRSVYGITLEQYNTILQEQNNCCDICKKQQSELLYDLSVDHDHKTGKVRGLLCQTCNSALGYSKEDVNICLGIINYINKHKKN